MPQARPDMRYIVLSGKSPRSQEGRSLHNLAFDFWKEFWPEVFRENKAYDSHIDPKQFWRQDMVTCIMHGGRIVAQHLYTRYDLRSHADRAQSYLQDYSEDFFTSLEKADVSEVMSMEFLAVKSGENGVPKGIPLASTLIKLAFKQQHAQKIPCMITISRSDNGVTWHLKKVFGMIQVGPEGTMHNTPVAQLFRTQSEQERHKSTKDLAQQLWECQENYQSA